MKAPTLSIPRFAPLMDMSLKFDGVDDIVTAPTPQDWTGSDGFTVTFWADLAEIEAGVSAGILGIAGAGGDGAFWAIDAAFRLHAYFNHVENVLPLDAWGRGWVYVATIYDAMRMSLTTFVGRGDLSDTVYLSSPSKLPTNGNITIGHAGTDAYPHFRGRISRISLFKVALRARDAIAARYDMQFGAEVRMRPDLVGSWRLNEGYGTIAFDYASAEGCNGILGGGEPAAEPAWVIGRPPVGHR
ncbi:MAG TPA: LamG-like jellyroll fold domain-containing protein [Longimicrobiales bacterium]